MASNSGGEQLLKDPSGESFFNVSFSNLFILSNSPVAVGLYGRWKVHKISWASAHSFTS